MHLLDKSQVLDLAHIIIVALLERVSIILKFTDDRDVRPDHEDVEKDHENDEKSRCQVGPNVHAFVVNHEQALDDFVGSVKVDSIAVGDGIVVLHEVRSCLVVPDEVFFSLGLFNILIRLRVFVRIFRSCHLF